MRYPGRAFLWEQEPRRMEKRSEINQFWNVMNKIQNKTSSWSLVVGNAPSCSGVALGLGKEALKPPSATWPRGDPAWLQAALKTPSETASMAVKVAASDVPQEGWLWSQWHDSNCDLAPVVKPHLALVSLCVKLESTVPALRGAWGLCWCSQTRAVLQHKEPAPHA